VRESDGGPILVAASSTLVHTQMEHDLVDDYRMMVFPFVHRRPGRSMISVRTEFGFREPC
jgi:hypothetical protein